jgi:hypothetical protein
MGKNKKNQQIIIKSDLINVLWKDISDFKALLEEYMGDYIQDLSGLEQAVNEVNKKQNNCWGYKADRVIFKDLYLYNSRKTENTYLDLTIKIRGHINPQNPIDDFLDDDYCLEFLVKQYRDAKVIKNAYRVERHKYDKDDNTPEFIHPLYHLQYGGDKLTDDEDFETGDVLFCDAPRIMHPPMDIILAIDFVLANYYSFHACDEYRKLLKDEGYQKIVKNAKNRFWRPYFLGLAANFIGENRYSFQGINNLSVDKFFAQNLLAYKKEH